MQQSREEIFIPPNLETRKYSTSYAQVYERRDQEVDAIQPIELDLYTGIIFLPAFACRTMRQFSG
jgi:hypothetical protein